jgi:hypothetical protein
MAQNSQRMNWTREEVDQKLHKIMVSIHRNCFETAAKYGTPGNLVNGRQHRRLPQGGQRDDGPGTRVETLLAVFP